jgi:3-oxoacyl-[acyl-carrier protein] reductase
MGLLDDRVAVVTGAGRGIGRAVALRFVDEGARVVVNDRDAGPAEEVVAACLARRPESAVAAVGSVAVRADAERIVGAAAQHFGSLDILVNNAGLARDRVVHRMEDDDWDQVLAVNLSGTFYCVRAAAPYLRGAAQAEIDTHGAPLRVRKVVNFYSTAAIRGNPGQINYTAAKMGVVGLTRTLAQEWGRYRIGVNAVAPGFTDTRMTATRLPGDELGVPEAHRQAMLSRIPFGRIGTPDDVAAVVLFLASPLSDYVTGQEINVSGGLQIP